ncbi:MAG TPA: hypothetical protein ENJ18_02910 [Nannocystis exedens]|nr:hypothetical protein [Nannocystis exedens]
MGSRSPSRSSSGRAGSRPGPGVAARIVRPRISEHARVRWRYCTNRYEGTPPSHRVTGYEIEPESCVVQIQPAQKNPALDRTQ